MQILKNCANLNFKKLEHRQQRCCETRNRQKTQRNTCKGRIHERAADEVEGRKPKATTSSHLELDLTATSSTTTTTNRTEAELAEMAAALTHVPRDQWPDDILTYQRDVDRNRKRKAMQAEDDRLRRAKSNNNAVKSSLPKSLPTNQKNNATIYDHVPMHAKQERSDNAIRKSTLRTPRHQT